jgi:hypothetical protein
MRPEIVSGSDYRLPGHTRARQEPSESNGNIAKQKYSFHVYQMSSDEDYFYHHPNSVLLGFLVVVAAILLLVMLAFWIGYKAW